MPASTSQTEAQLLSVRLSSVERRLADLEARNAASPGAGPASSSDQLQKLMLHEMMVQNNKAGFTWQRVVATVLIVFITLLVLSMLI